MSSRPAVMLRGAAAAPRSALLAALVLLGACADAPTPPQEADSAPAATREARIGDPVPLQSEAGGYTAQVALPFEIESEEGADHLTILFGQDEAWMRCYVYPEEVALGLIALRLVQAGRAYFDAQGGDFALKQLSGARGGAIGSAPYHALEWTYSDPGMGATQIKAAAANKRGRGIACLDLNLGFRQSFWRVFEGLVASFEPAELPPAAYFEEIVVTRVNDLDVGVSWISFTRDADGDTQIDTGESLLLPSGADDMLASYAQSISWAKPGGELINAVRTERDLSSEHTRLALAYERDGGWRVRGVFKGETLDTMLGREEWIDSLLARYQRVQARLPPNGSERQVRVVEWVPAMDPTSVFEASYEVTPEDPSRYTMTVGERVSTGDRSPEGFVDTGVIDLGPGKMLSEVVYREGGL